MLHARLTARTTHVHSRTDITRLQTFTRHQTFNLNPHTTLDLYCRPRSRIIISDPDFAANAEKPTGAAPASPNSTSPQDRLNLSHVQTTLLSSLTIIPTLDGGFSLSPPADGLIFSFAE